MLGRSLTKLLRNSGKRPFKQYIRRGIDLSLDHDREIRLLQSALKDRGTSLTYSQVIEKMIDDFLGKLGKSDE